LKSINNGNLSFKVQEKHLESENNMNFTDVISISFNAITERKYRFFLNLVGILIGITAITGLVSLTQGMNTEINEQLDILGINSITIIPGSGDSNTPMMAQGPQIMNSPITLSWRDRNVISNILEIDEVAEVQSNYCAYTIAGKDYVSQVVGVGVNIFSINSNFGVSEGRVLSRNDKAAVIIGQNIAKPNSEDKSVLQVGDRLIIKTIGEKQDRELTLRIVGIAKESGTTMGVSPDDMIVIPIRTSEQFFDSAGEYSMLMASIYNLDDMDIVEKKIKDYIDDAIVVTPRSAKEMVESIIGTLESVLGGIAGISLLVAGVGIVNTMTTSVNERTREIGILKALGAKNFDVLFLFLNEAAYTGITGGFFGGGLGFLLGRMVGNYIGLTVDVNFSLWFSVIGFAIITSLIAGAIPAFRASKLDPVDALRHE
jgi:putative ABC transport system permease protein